MFTTKKPIIYLLLVLLLSLMGIAFFISAISSPKQPASQLTPSAQTPKEVSESPDYSVDQEYQEFEQEAKALFTIPVYPGTERVADTAVDSEFFASWEVKQPVPMVTDWYVNTLSDDDWEIEIFPQDPANDNSQSIQARDDTWRIFLSVEKNNQTAKTTISLTREFAPRE